MKKFNTLTSLAMPLNIKDIDTDMIIPADYLKSTEKGGFGQHLFERLRNSDQKFPLSSDKYEKSRIIIADENFGCGSSREHAVWAIQEAKFRVIIGKSFSDIFFANAAKNGLLLITLAPDLIDHILEHAKKDEYKIEVNLERETIKLPDKGKYKFQYDEFRKHCLLNGVDDLEYIMKHDKEIAKYSQS